ncbi:hypothetical protein [Luteimicrobium subarcticum]|uniref:Cobalamin-independent methionine synthase catalytic subunit n=1 Tax=Luteimicrobium subarcticum TaxID=620910 RepID=A0A2M8W1A3_9MICO|nr:hypothetical protein [Luteimicrobium subarcticum]PJI84712.1 hypothetical protein CLV34_3167 [Luteimicrobium subarcticum]
MTRVTGGGPFPGTEPLDAQLAVLEHLVDTPFGVDGLPFVVQLPARGAGSDAVGRTAALLGELAVELGPHGWKLADRPGADQRRARHALRDDLTALSVAAHGYDGPLTLSVLGPWTTAATLYLARGDRVLADRGAAAEVAEALGAGVRELVADVRAQVPGVVDVVVQVEEPLLAPVGAGALPTFSGYARLRAVPGPDLVEGLRPVLGAVAAAGATSAVHVGAAWTGVAPAVLAGADGVGLDVGRWDERTWETVARLVERGRTFWAGLPRAVVSQCAGPDVGRVADALTVPWRRVGLPLAGLADVVVRATESAPSLAGPVPSPTARSLQDARGDLATLVRVAAVVAERADG